MAKLAVFTALLIALVGFTSAISYTTVVTTEVSDETNPSQCQKEMMMPMHHCRMWMREQMHGSQYDDALRSAVSNPQYQEGEHLEECCNQLRMVSRDCRCDAIRKTMMEHQKEFEMEEMPQMRKMVENLPRMCRMKSPTQCRMRTSFF